MPQQEGVLPLASYLPTIGDDANAEPPAYRASSHEKPSIDLPGHIEQKLAQYNASQSVFKCWLFEIISVITSAICMGAILGLLHYLDDQSLNKWPPDLTIITILSKVASVALILPISEAIGQLKWTWFHGKKSRDAFDFEIFDKASRGAWGTFMLLYSTNGRSLAALGALLTVLLLTIDTFFQQVTDLPERWKLRREGFISRSVRYEPKAQLQYDSTWDDGPVGETFNALQTTLNPFFYEENRTQPITTGNNVLQAEILLTCPTSRCEWPSYKTLGVCSSGEDVSHILEYACLTMRLDWIRNSTGPGTEDTYPSGTACGYFLNATSNDPVLMSGFRVENGTESMPGEIFLMRTLPLVENPFRESLYGGSINFKHVQTPLLDALIASSIDGTVENVYNRIRPVVQECMFAFCVKKWRSAYESGGYQEQLEEMHINTTSVEWPWWTQDFPEEGYTYMEFKSEIAIRPPSVEGKNSIFGLVGDTLLDFIGVLDEIFPSMLTVSNATAQPFIKMRTSFINKVMFRAVTFSPWLSPNDVTRHFERMATAMTNFIRSDASGNELIAGFAYTRETYVAVHWACLTFPLVMLALSVVFLAATIFKTSGENHSDIGKWKTSTMPTLIYSLPKETQDQVMSTTHSRGATGKSSSKVRIRLLPNQG